ncbi:MAG: hypothetical protein QOD95_1746, partial [Gammaproteobacteria bacterium]|nr:hypothetical protein [Gammaproteobacteria bacterium]
TRSSWNELPYAMVGRMKHHRLLFGVSELSHVAIA